MQSESKVTKPSQRHKTLKRPTEFEIVLTGKELDFAFAQHSIYKLTLEKTKSNNETEHEIEFLMNEACTFRSYLSE